MVTVADPTLFFIGHVSIDRIRNMWGERIQTGGAALFSSVGAKVLAKNVRIISAVGKDYKELDYIYTNFPGSLIKRVNMPSTYFDISYDEKFRAKYNEVKLGAGTAIKVTDLPSQLLRSGDIVHLSPMRPDKVERFVERIRKLSPKTWISLNSSPDYMAKPVNRKVLRRLTEVVDLTVVNDQEAMALAEAESLVTAIHTLKAKRLAVTLGQLGAIVVDGGKVQMIPALSGLTGKPKDTTGAGDTWCGALLAAYSQTEDWTKSVITACLISAIKCLGWGFEKLRRLRFRSTEEIVDYVLRLSEGKGQVSINEFLT
jgi:sugar/nucleoside kinase (ribokinase family)